jgi:hypothetical protein
MAALGVYGLREEGPIPNFMMTYFQFALLNPFGLLGVCAGALACSVVASPRRRPTIVDWLLALIANAAHPTFLYVAFAGPSQLNAIILVLIFGGGVGFGLGWVLRLIWLTIWPGRLV